LTRNKLAIYIYIYIDAPAHALHDSPAQINRLHSSYHFEVSKFAVHHLNNVQILDNLLQEEHHVSVPPFHFCNIMHALSVK